MHFWFEKIEPNLIIVNISPMAAMNTSTYLPRTLALTKVDPVVSQYHATKKKVFELVRFQPIPTCTNHSESLTNPILPEEKQCVVRMQRRVWQILPFSKLLLALGCSAGQDTSCQERVESIYR